jgi:molybdopterin converting factor small subunit
MSPSKEYKPTHGGYPGTVPQFPVRNNLSAALALIDKPENWIRGGLGIGCGCYCMLGAIATQQGLRETGHHEGGIYATLDTLPEVQELASALCKEEPGRFRSWMRDSQVVYSANDDTAAGEGLAVRHERTIALFKRAIQRVQA